MYEFMEALPTEKPSESSMYRLKDDGNRFRLHLSPMLLIFGHPVRRGAGRPDDLLVGLFLGLAKLVINRSRQRAVEEEKGFPEDETSGSFDTKKLS
eukprot:g42104.t1